MLYSKLSPLPDAFGTDEWSISQMSDTEAVAFDPVVPEPTTAETGTTHAYVIFPSLCLVDYHVWISSDEGSRGNTDESSNVMLASCQDELLAATYKNLPEIP